MLTQVKKRTCKKCGAYLNSYNKYDWCWPHIPDEEYIPQSVMNDRPKRISPRKYTNDQLLTDLREWIDRNGRTPTKSDREGLATVDTYNSHFGSWGNALREVGAEPLKYVPRKYESPVLDAVLESVKRGNTTRSEVAKDVGCPPASATYALINLAAKGLIRKERVAVNLNRYYPVED